MAPLRKNSISHFTHPEHQLTLIDANQEYSCDGCRTLGNGKRYRCHTCDFDLHDYCGTCPETLSSFMHKDHALRLVMRKAQGARQVDRVCDVCEEPVEGLFYQCKECEFDVHPLCTQLPEKLQHALHKVHPLCLEAPALGGFCIVCRDLCTSWRYRCKACCLDIHLECVLKPTVPCPQTAQTTTNQRGIPTSHQGIPFQPPPQFAPDYAHAFPPYGPGYPFRPGFNMYQNPYNTYPPNSIPHNQVSSSNNGAGRGRKRAMFALVAQLGVGVISSMIFGVDLF